MGPNTEEARRQLRAYLSRQRAKGPLSEPQEAAWWALNDIEALVGLLQRIDRSGAVSPGILADIRVVLEFHGVG